MPKFLERELKEEYGESSDVPYKILNSIGGMHGNKITPKGIRMEEQHERDTVRKTVQRRLRGKP